MQHKRKGTHDVFYNDGQGIRKKTGYLQEIGEQFVVLTVDGREMQIPIARIIRVEEVSQ